MWTFPNITRHLQKRTFITAGPVATPSICLKLGRTFTFFSRRTCSVCKSNLSKTVCRMHVWNHVSLSLQAYTEQSLHGLVNPRLMKFLVKAFPIQLKPELHVPRPNTLALSFGRQQENPQQNGHFLVKRTWDTQPLLFFSQTRKINVCLLVEYRWVPLYPNKQTK